MGLIIISYTIRDVSDENGYLEAYGAGAIANVKREERIKVAEAKSRSEIKKSELFEEKEKSRFENQIIIAQQIRDRELRQESVLHPKWSV